MRKLTYEEVKEYIENIDGYVLISKDYGNSKEKLEIKCKNNHSFKMTLTNLKQGKRCSECQGVIRWDYERVKKYIEIDSNSNYTLLSESYENARTKLKIKCDNNHSFEATFANFYNNNSRCPRCQGCGKLTRDIVKQFIEVDSNSGYKLLSKEYKNNNTKIDLLCPEGHVYNVTFGSFQQGHRCKECAEIEKIKRQTHTYEYVKNYIEVESDSGYKLLSDNYIDNETHLDVTCDQEHIYKTSFGNFVMGARCKKCYHIRNSGSGNHRWNPNRTQEEREMQRHIQGYPEWRLKVYERDSYTCQCCGDDKGGNLNAHHLDGYNWCEERRTDVSNGVVLCDDCHTDFHLNYGYGDNTEEQYNKWIKSKLINKTENNIPILNTSN